MGKKIEGVQTDFIFTKSGTEIKIKINPRAKLSKKIKCKLEMPKYVKSIDANGEKTTGCIATFELNAKNVVTASLVNGVQEVKRQ
jgi:hypothetical protein